LEELSKSSKPEIFSFKGLYGAKTKQALRIFPHVKGDRNKGKMFKNV
jgi:hypothetical protein